MSFPRRPSITQYHPVGSPRMIKHQPNAKTIELCVQGQACNSLAQAPAAMKLPLFLDDDFWFHSTQADFAPDTSRRAASNLGVKKETIRAEKSTLNQHQFAEEPEATRRKDTTLDSLDPYENMPHLFESVHTVDSEHVPLWSRQDMRTAVRVAFMVLTTANYLVGLQSNTSFCLEGQAFHTAFGLLQDPCIMLNNAFGMFISKPDLSMVERLIIGLPLLLRSATIRIPKLGYPNYNVTMKPGGTMTVFKPRMMDRKFLIVILILCGVPYSAADPISGGYPSQPTATGVPISRLIVISTALMILSNILGNVSTALNKTWGALLIPGSALSCVLLVITTSNRDDLPIWMPYPIGIVWALLSMTTLRVERRKFEPEQRTLFTTWILLCTVGLVYLASATKSTDLQTAIPSSFSAATYIIARLLPRRRPPLLPQYQSGEV
ncbi:hypothetical protein BDV97DRAFT_424358 [Delphinella strobiligena]|nr:hypothetical protein BDV97DRAFT_424358 [Delphinella strobiligena]